MSTKIGDLFFDVYADVSKAVKNIESVGSTAVRVGGEAARAIGQTIANAVGLATGATALLVATTLNAGAAYNTLGQSATAAFSSIYGDLTAAHSILQDISLLDLETPFQGKALTATARTLAGFGFQLSDVVSTTSALAQATAAMGLGSDALHRMAIAFGQIQSRGKLAGDEARQLANYGIDAYGLLADKLGLTVAATRELGQAGKLTADVVIPALVDSIQTRFAGATEKLFNTAAGQAEGLRSVMEGVGSALVEPFIGFSSGGVLVDAMAAIRKELLSVVTVAEDGSFKLQGFLAPLTPIVEGLAEAVGRAGQGFANFLSTLDEGSLTNLFMQFEGLGPLIAGTGAALLTVFAQAIPFVGRFVAGFNPIVVGLTALILTSDELRASLVTTLERIWEAVQPLIPGIQELVSNILDIAEQGIPIVFDAIATAVEDLAPAVDSAIDATNKLVTDLGPAFVEILQATADALGIIGAIIGALPPDFVALTAAVYGLSILFPTVTVGFAAAAAAASLSGGAAALAATGWGLLGAAILVAAAAVGSFNAIKAGMSGDLDYLNRDVPFYEKPFQLAGRGAFALFGGDREQVAQTAEVNRLLEEGAQLGEAFAQSQRDSGLSMNEFAAAAREVLPTVEASNQAIIAYRESLDAVQQAHVDAGNAVDAFTAANAFEARVARELGGATAELIDTQETEVDILKELKAAAEAAWAEVDKLLRPTQEATLDDFLRELPKLAEDVTNALAAQNKKPDILSALGLSGAEEAVREAARKVVQVLAKEYGVGLDGIKALLDQRGLGAVIEALGTITAETTETVDPLIAKYAYLGATADQLSDAISRLNDQRQTAIQAQIDQVGAALRDAKQAAQDARDAVAEFFSGGYLGSAQQQVDKLIGDIGSIGSNIEEALQMGGVRGDAAVRSALGDLQGQLAAIVNAGFEQGLSGQQIADLIAPVVQAINEEIGSGANRISSLDFSEGITAGAGQRLMDALQSGLDPGAIQALINNILGADASVAGLESQLEGLQTALHTDVEFSAAQVQGALDAISAEQTHIVTTPVVTPEAAQLVYDAIQSVLSDPNNELDAAVNQALIADQIMEAAQAAQDEISLVFRSGLSFDSAELDAVARAVSDEFYAAFSDQMNQLRDRRAQEAGFESYPAMVAALGPAVAAATIGAPPPVSVTIDAPIAVTAIGADPPAVTATQVVAGQSAGAGTNGTVSDLLTRYGRR